MNLPYKIEINPISEHEGGGYEANIPQLGRMTMTGMGDTPAEALESLHDVKETVFTMWLEKNKPIPEPRKDENETSCNGKILLRISKELHRELIFNAKEQGLSLNSYLQQVILLGFSLETFKHNAQNITEEKLTTVHY